MEHDNVVRTQNLKINSSSSLARNRSWKKTDPTGVRWRITCSRRVNKRCHRIRSSFISTRPIRPWPSGIEVPCFVEFPLAGCLVGGRSSWMSVRARRNRRRRIFDGFAILPRSARSPRLGRGEAEGTNWFTYWLRHWCAFGAGEKTHVCAVFRVHEAACVGVGPSYPEGAARKVQGLNARCRWRELKPKRVASWSTAVPRRSCRFSTGPSCRRLWISDRRPFNSLEMPLTV